MPVLLQISLLLALAVVLLITFLVGLKAEAEARDSLEDQIERHLTDESAEAAATIGERFRRIQNAVLDVTAFAIRDALQEVSVSTINEESFMANDDRLVVIHNDEGHAMVVLLQTFSPMPNADRYLTLCVRTILKFCMCVYFSNIFHTSSSLGVKWVCLPSLCSWSVERGNFHFPTVCERVIRSRELWSAVPSFCISFCVFSTSRLNLMLTYRASFPLPASRYGFN